VVPREASTLPPDDVRSSCSFFHQPYSHTFAHILLTAHVSFGRRIRGQRRIAMLGAAPYAVFLAFATAALAHAALSPRQTQTSQTPTMTPSPGDSCSGNMTLTSSNGLMFDTYSCMADAKFATDPAGFWPSGQSYGVYTVFVSMKPWSLAECLEQCAIDPDPSPCVALIFDQSSVPTGGGCYLANSSVDWSADRLVLDSNATTAFVSSKDLSLIRNINASCPYANSTTRTMPNGLSFQIYCESESEGDDWTPGSNINGTAIQANVHTESFDACMQYCENMRPTCAGVTFSPTTWANCAPMGREAAQVKYLHPADKSHVALAQFAPIDSSCTNGFTSAGIASTNSTFEVTCDGSASGTITSAVFSRDLADCIKACASTTHDECTAVSFDAAGNDGYLNCYLLSSAQNNGSRPFWRVAQRLDDELGETASSNTSSSDGSGGSSSSSKVWTAGPVVGALAAFAAVVSAAWWCRRRRGDKSGKQLASGSHRRSELDANFTERKELDTKHPHRDPAELPG
jgi:hypothetical protein